PVEAGRFQLPADLITAWAAALRDSRARISAPLHIKGVTQEGVLQGRNDTRTDQTTTLGGQSDSNDDSSNDGRSGYPAASTSGDQAAPVRELVDRRRLPADDIDMSIPGQLAVATGWLPPGTRTATPPGLGKNREDREPPLTH